MTPEQLQSATGCTATVADKWVAPLAAAMRAWGITTPARQAGFLSQIAHESGRFVYVRELWGPTIAQRRYEGRADLGNTVPGDGKRFMGRGLIQITGRTNYAAAGKALGLDLLANPALLEAPDAAATSAGWFWSTRGLNALADAKDVVGMTRRINGGLNGLVERQALYLRACKTFGVTA